MEYLAGGDLHNLIKLMSKNELYIEEFLIWNYAI